MMAVQYKRLEALVHATLGNIKFQSASEAQTNYATTATLITQLKTGDYNKDFIRDTILNAMAKVAAAICEMPSNPDRQLFRNVVGPVSSSGTTGTVLQPSFGPYGAFYDGTDGRPLKPRALHSVLNMLASETAGNYTSGTHAYIARSGNMAWFISPNGTMRYEQFTFTKPANTVFDGSTDSVFTDNYEGVIVAGAVRDVSANVNPTLASLHNAYYESEIGRIKTGVDYKPAALPPLPEA